MSGAMARVLAALSAHGRRPSWSGANLLGHCPAHEDHNKSLSATEGEDGRALIKCHAGCTSEAIVAALGLTLADLFERRNGHKPQIVAAYDYTDADGTLLYQAVRMEPKDFRFRRPDGNGGYNWKLGRTKRVLYRLPDVIRTVEDRGTVYVVEGEKDADTINALPDAGNVIATCNPGGASKYPDKPKWRPEYSEVLKGATVVIVADKDEPGRVHAEAVAASLEGFVSSVRIVEAKEGKDAADHLAAGYGLDSFVPVETAETPKPADSTLHAVDIADTLSRPLEPPDYMIDSLIVRRDKGLLAGEFKLGKSFLALALAVALVTGRKFLDLLEVASGPYRVLYVDEENSERLIRYRLRKLAYALELGADALANLRYLRGNRLNLDNAGRLEALHRDAGDFGPDLIVFDSLIRFHRRAENDNSEASAFYLDVLCPLAEEHKAGLLPLHHLSKPSRDRDGGDLVHRIRGAGDIVGQVDEVLTLERGGSDALLLTLQRSRWGDEGKSYLVRIQDTDDGEGVRLVGEEPEADATTRGSVYAAIRDRGTEGGCCGKR